MQEPNDSRGVPTAVVADNPVRGCPAATSEVASAMESLLSLEPEAIRCPYSVYETLRKDSPVYWSERLGAYVVSRHSDIVRVLADPVRYSSAQQSGPSSVTALAKKLLDDPRTPPTLLRQVQRRLEINHEPALINADPPLHLRQRRLVSQGFTPRRVKMMEPEVRRIAGELLDAVESEGAMDFVSQFAVPLPTTVIANVLGVPPERQADFKRWSNAFTRGVGALDLSMEQIGAVFQAVDEFYDYFTQQIEARRTDPRDDLLTDLVAARVDDGEALTLNEMLQMLVVFLVGGNETTTNLLAWTTHRLLTDPALMAKVREDFGLLRPLAEEMLRLESPVQGLFRTATEDVRLGDVAITAGSMLWLVYASGNRDEEAMGPADAVDLDRADTRQHLAFGRGEHFCLGASIARLEAYVGMELVLSRFPDLSLVSEEMPPVHSSFVLHGLRELPVSLDAR